MDRLAASTSQPPPPPPGLPPPEPAVSEEINHWSMLADNMQSSSLRSFENIESYLSQDLLRVTAQNKGIVHYGPSMMSQRKTPWKDPERSLQLLWGHFTWKDPSDFNL